MITNANSKTMRQRLTQAINNAFKHDGYTLYQGFTYQINNTKLVLPCVWVNPAELVAIQGRNEGVATYKVTIYLFTQNDNSTEREKELKWAEMEQQAIDSYKSLLCDEWVNDVSSLSISPDEFAYTGFKELSVKATFNVNIRYCNG